MLIHKFKSVFVFLLVAFLLISVTDYVPYVKEKPWPQAVENYLSRAFKNDYMKNIETSEYLFSLKFKSKFKAAQQTTLLGRNRVISIDRQSGDIKIFDIDDIENIKTVTVNSPLSKLIQDLNKRKNINSIMDIHSAFGKIFISYLDISKAHCHSLVLNSYNLDVKEHTIKKIESMFKTPCIRNTTNLVLWGGRIASNGKEIFLSIGEQRYNKSGIPMTMYFQKNQLGIDQTVFGKIISINPVNKKYRIFSKGHRNVQGLYFDQESNKLIATEHGPYGGDEINIIEEGFNYGWPSESFGGIYPDDRMVIDQAENQVSHPNYFSHSLYQPPIYSFTPSIGPSSVYKIPSNSILMNWRSDFLVGEMAAGRLGHLKLNSSYSKVILNEQIELLPIRDKFRIRDIEVTQNGILILSLDQGWLLGYEHLKK